jgi:hypothetical protein
VNMERGHIVRPSAPIRPLLFCIRHKKFGTDGAQ